MRKHGEADRARIGGAPEDGNWQSAPAGGPQRRGALQAASESPASELEEREQKLKQKEEELAKKEQKLTELEKTMVERLKGNLYDRIHVSVGTLDKIIVALIILLILFLTVGIYQSVR